MVFDKFYFIRLARCQLPFFSISNLKYGWSLEEATYLVSLITKQCQKAAVLAVTMLVERLHIKIGATKNTTKAEMNVEQEQFSDNFTVLHNYFSNCVLRLFNTA